MADVDERYPADLVIHRVGGHELGVERDQGDLDAVFFAVCDDALQIGVLVRLERDDDLIRPDALEHLGEGLVAAQIGQAGQAVVRGEIVVDAEAERAVARDRRIVGAGLLAAADQQHMLEVVALFAESAQDAPQHPPLDRDQERGQREKEEQRPARKVDFLKNEEEREHQPEQDQVAAQQQAELGEKVFGAE